MKNEPYYMVYYRNLALLNSVLSLEGLFHSHMIARTDKDLKVRLAPQDKKDIMRSIGSKAKDPLSASRQYIRRLKEAGLIKLHSRGIYKINPLITGFSANSEYLKYHRYDYAEITIQMTPDGKRKVSSMFSKKETSKRMTEVFKQENGDEYIINNDGVMIFL